MPGSAEGMMYSFNLGPIHFISISTEFYYFLNYGIKQLVLQYEWLEADLVEANKPENRYKNHFLVNITYLGLARAPLRKILPKSLLISALYYLY